MTYSLITLPTYAIPCCRQDYAICYAIFYAATVIDNAITLRFDDAPCHATPYAITPPARHFVIRQSLLLPHICCRLRLRHAILPRLLLRRMLVFVFAPCLNYHLCLLPCHIACYAKIHADICRYLRRASYY